MPTTHNNATLSLEHSPARKRNRFPGHSDLELINRYRDLVERGFGSRVTIWRKVRAGKFPTPENILDRPGWRESVIQSYLASC